jgi:ATP-binding cassette, subfamily C, bacterial CydC
LPPAALTLRSALASGRRLLEVVHRTPSVRDPLAPAPAPADGPVALDSVYLSPDDAGSWGLRGVHLSLGPGQGVALVGRSGAGKSTIAELLVRFLDPDGGRVVLAGTDVRDLAQHEVRRRITLDGQDGHLFSTSIVENLRLARQDADDAALEAALRRARLWDWVAQLPQGWDTVVGEDGASISGGERRRLALARAFLADTRVLVLDEPSAHLDHATAAALVADALSTTRDRGVLLITHREEAASTQRVLRLRRGAIIPQRIPQLIPRG